MDLQVYKRLLEAASIYGSTLPLQYLSDELCLGYDMSQKADRKALFMVIDEISKFEYENNRPLLWGLIRSKAKYKKEVIAHFYKFCETLGIDSKEKLKEVGFKIQAQKACYKHWQQLAIEAHIHQIKLKQAI